MRLEDELKEIILSEFNIKDIEANTIKDDDLLFSEGLGLDSLDAIELTVILKKHYNIKVSNRNVGRKIFVSIKSIADYIRQQKSAF